MKYFNTSPNSEEPSSLKTDSSEDSELDSSIYAGIEVGYAFRSKSNGLDLSDRRGVSRQLVERESLIVCSTLDLKPIYFELVLVRTLVKSLFFLFARLKELYSFRVDEDCLRFYDPVLSIVFLAGLLV